MFLCNFMLSGH